MDSNTPIDQNEKSASQILFPTQENQVKESVTLPSSDDLLQGAPEFYVSIKNATVASLQAAAPFQNKHPALDQCINEILRYLELSSMYMDRFIMYANNPQVLETENKKGES